MTDARATLQRRSRWAGWVFGVFALAAVVGVGAHLGEVEHFVRLIRGLDPAWLVLACAAQSGTYASTAWEWRLGLRAIAIESPFRRLLSLAVQKLFVDQTVPSGGLSGNAYLVSALGRQGVARADCFGVVLASLVAHYLAYLAVALAAVGLLRMQQLWRGWMVVMVAAFILVCLAIPIGLLLLHRFEGALPHWLVRRPGFAATLVSYGDAPLTLLRRRGLLLRMALLDLSVHAFDALTLWLLLAAIGISVAPALVFVSFVLGTMAAMLGPLPMGLGAFEGACVGSLVAGGVPIEAALVGTLLLRGWTTWLPMLPGLWLTRMEWRASLPKRGEDAPGGQRPGPVLHG